MQRSLFTVSAGVLLGVFTFLMTACYDPHAQDSKIVREVEAAGSGNLSTYTLQGLEQWFMERPQLATKIAYECLPLRKTATANWLTTAEGSVCQAASATAPPPPMTADPRAW
ncbi:MAG: hypothetical protein JOY95_07055 [Silvibacterium sp.]|nr:hypothetical protein [Silvibacterium sp.]